MIKENHKRINRCHIIAVEIMMQCDGKHPIREFSISAKQLRLSILKKLNYQPLENAKLSLIGSLISWTRWDKKSIDGDMRAHGDALHSIGVKRDGRGNVVVSKETFRNCQLFLMNSIHNLLEEPHSVFKKAVPRLHLSTIEGATVVVVSWLSEGRYKMVIKSDSGYVCFGVDWMKRKVLNVYNFSSFEYAESALEDTLSRYFAQPTTPNPSWKRLDPNEDYISQHKRSPHFKRPHLAVSGKKIIPRKASIINKDDLSEEALADAERFVGDWNAEFASTLREFGELKSYNFEEFKLLLGRRVR